MRSSRSSLQVAGAMAACLISGSAFAYASGQTGFSGKQANATCAGSTCHSGSGAAPTVTLEGPDTLAAGATGTYTLVIKGGPAVRGGFNVASDTGTLEVVSGSGAKKLSGELTHTAPKAFTNGELRFDFTLVAPASGTVKLFGAGNSTNFNSEPTGDTSAQNTKTVTVTGGSDGGDDEGGCSATAGAPLLGAVLMLLGARSRRRR